MVLTVPYNDFPAAAQRAGIKDVFLSDYGKGTVITNRGPS